jgi:hypothetical protein
MPAESILEVVASLSLEEQEAVRAFVDFLRRRSSEVPSPSGSPFVRAAQEFVREHPELLRRLAQ